jgi:predicted nucleic acid binding AN1-type Zn finger protein
MFTTKNQEKLNKIGNGDVKVGLQTQVNPAVFERVVKSSLINDCNICTAGNKKNDVPKTTRG